MGVMFYVLFSILDVKVNHMTENSFCMRSEQYATCSTLKC